MPVRNGGASRMRRGPGPNAFLPSPKRGVYWQQRLGSASSQLEQLATREAEARETLAEAQSRPQALAAQRAGLLEHMSAAEADRRQAADVLVQAETELSALVQASKEAQSALAGAREERVRMEGLVSQTDQLKFRYLAQHERSA